MKRIWLLILILLLFWASLIFSFYGSPVRIPGKIPKGQLSAYVLARVYDPTLEASLSGPGLGLNSMKLLLKSQGMPAGMLKNVHCILVLNFDPCSEERQEKIYHRLESILSDCEPLYYEPSFEGEGLLRLYGTLGERRGQHTISDVVILNSINHRLLCFYGTMPLDKFNEWWTR